MSKPENALLKLAVVCISKCHISLYHYSM